MSKYLRYFGLLLLALVAVGALAFSTGSASPATAAPAAQACDPSGSVDGSAQPATALPGDRIDFTVWNFAAGEEVSYWFTTPSGDVFGTANPLCCVPESGRLTLVADPVFTRILGLEPGRWALTVQGATSNHTSVVYFCIVTQIQPTATAVPPTATPVPPTATTEPATPTTVATETATAVVTSTVVIETPTSVVSPTLEPTVAPTLEPTAVPTEVIVEPTAMPVETVVPISEPTVVGMPRTGSGGDDFALYLLVALTAVGVFSVGVVARKASSSRR